MADLAEVINGLTAIQNGSDGIGLPTVGPKKRGLLIPDDSFLSFLNNVKGPVATLFGDRTEQLLAPTLPEAFGNLVTAPTALWALGDLGLQWATDKKASLPGGEGALEITKSIQDPIRRFSNRLAGEPLNDSLLQTDDPTQLGASWARLGASSLLGLPGSVLSKASEGIRKVNTGVDAIDTTARGAAAAVEAIAPAVVPVSPVTRTGSALNVALPAAVGTGIEAAIGPPAIREALNAEASVSTDTAIRGAQEAASSQPLQVTPKPVQAGFITGNPWIDGAIVGVASIAGLAAFRRDVATRVFGGITREADPSVVGGQKVETILGPGSVATHNYVDINDPIKTTMLRALDEAGVPKQTGRDMVTKFANQVDAASGAAIETKIRSVYEFGEIPGSNVRLPRPIDLHALANKVRAADEVRYRSLVDALNARRELDIRQRIAARDFRVGTPGNYGNPRADLDYLNAVARGRINEYNTAHNMFDVGGGQPLPGRELARRWTSAFNDPELRPLIQQFDMIGKRMLDYAVEQRAITAAERTRLLRENPHYFMTKLAPGETHLSLFNPQARGGLNEMGDPFEELPKYIEQVFRHVEFNKVQRDYIELMERLRAQGNPVASAILGRKDVQHGPSSRDVAINYRDRAGNARTMEIKDVIVRRALQHGGDMSRLHALSGAMGSLARMFESSATGTVATALGSPFAPVSMMYSSIYGAPARPAGMAAGWIDLALQRATQGRFGMPGDMTNLLDAALIRMPVGVAAVMAQHAARALHLSAVTNGLASRALTPQNADMIATALTNMYKRTWVHEFQQMGLLGPNAMLGTNPATIARDAVRRMAMAGTPRGTIAETLQFLNEMIHTFGASPGATLLALNKGKDRDLVASAIRNFTGDPGKSGAFAGDRAVRGGAVDTIAQNLGPMTGKALAATPWGNIWVQALHKLQRIMRDPKTASAFITGLTTTVGTGVISAGMYNLALGPQYVDYWLNRRNPDRQSMSVYVGLPGLPPEDGAEIPIEPIARPYKLAVELLMAQQLGLFDGSIYKSENDGMRNALIDAAGKRWLSAGDGSVWSSAFQQSVMPPTPPVLAAGAALLGKNMRGYDSVTDIPSNRQAGFTDSTAMNPHRGLEVNIGGLHWELAESAQAQAVMRALGANAGHIAYNMFMDTNQRIKEGQPAGQVLKNIKQQYTLNAKDSAKFAGGLLGGFQSVSPSQEAASRLVSEKLTNINKLSDAFRGTSSSGVTMTDFTGSQQRGYQPLPGASVSVMPKDAQIAELAQIVSQYKSQIDRMFVGPTRDDYVKRQSIQASTQFSPERKRDMMNIVGNAIIQRNRDALRFMQIAEENLSKRYGRVIRFDKMDSSQGIDQFEPIARLP